MIPNTALPDPARRVRAALLGGLFAVSACTGDSLQVADTHYCSKSPSVVDGAMVIRGGSLSANAFADGGDVDINGYMTDLSVNCSGTHAVKNTQPNRERYKAGIPNAQYGLTTAKEICKAGGYIKPTPYPGHPHHCTVWHLKPKAAASMFASY